VDLELADDNGFRRNWKLRRWVLPQKFRVWLKSLG